MKRKRLFFTIDGSPNEKSKKRANNSHYLPGTPMTPPSKHHALNYLSVSGSSPTRTTKPLPFNLTDTGSTSPSSDAEAQSSPNAEAYSDESSGAGASPSTPPSSSFFYSNTSCDQEQPLQSPTIWTPTPDLEGFELPKTQTLTLDQIRKNASLKMLTPNMMDARDEHPHKKYKVSELGSLYSAQEKINNSEKENDPIWVDRGVRVRFILKKDHRGQPKLYLGLEGRPSQQQQVPSHLNLGGGQSVISAGTVTLEKDQNGDVKVAGLDPKSGGYCRLNSELAETNLIGQMLPFLKQHHLQHLAPTLQIKDAQKGFITHRVEIANAQPTASPSPTVM